MELVKIIDNDEIFIYTTTKTLGDMSLKNSYQDALNNRLELLKILDKNTNNFIAPHQSHTNNFKEVSKKDGGLNFEQLSNQLENIDALYTKDKDLILMSFHADCTPILLYCQDKKIIAAIHSGWPGTVKQITSKVTKHLIENEKCDPKLIKAYIGPCLSYKNFEIQEDVLNQIKNLPFDTTKYYQQKDNTHYLLDNKGLNKQQLLNCGLLDENIWISPYCTIDNNDLFYSHRKDHNGKRSITFIGRK